MNSPGRPVAPEAAAGQVRSLGIVTYALGSDRDLVYSESQDASQVLAVTDVDVLTSCREFKTIEAHARTMCESSGLPVSHSAAFVEILERFATQGLLVSRNALLDRCRRTGATPPAAITRVGVVTRNRPDALGRCLDSYAVNLKEHGRTPPLVVMDDSDAPEARQRTRDILTSLKSRYGISVAYSGREEKARFLKALVQAGISPEGAEFALTDAEAVGYAPGANRNSLLLETVGELLVGVDDDTVCSLAEPPELEHVSLRVSASNDPTDVWGFPDRESAIRAARPVDRDFVGAHEEYLGRGLASLLAAADDTLDLDPMDARTLRNLMMGQGQILVTQNGLVGDCAMGTSMWVIDHAGRSRERMLRTESDYSIACSSREVIRATLCHTVTNKPFLMTYGAGFDNRQLLPPFMPVSRFEDGIFALVLCKTLEGAHFAHLPWLVQHAPVESRAFLPEDVWKQASSHFMPQALSVCLDTYEIGGGKAGASARLQALGRHIAELSSLKEPEFQGFVRKLLWLEASQWIEALESRVEKFGANAPYWAKDVRRALDQIHQSLTHPEFILPSDLVGGRSPEQALRLQQRLILRYGKLLQEWPQIVEASRTLHGRGIKPAVTL